MTKEIPSRLNPPYSTEAARNLTQKAKAEEERAKNDFVIAKAMQEEIDNQNSAELIHNIVDSERHLGNNGSGNVYRNLHIQNRSNQQSHNRNRIYHQDHSNNRRSRANSLQKSDFNEYEVRSTY